MNKLIMKEIDCMKTKKTPRMASEHHLESPEEQFRPALVTPAEAAKVQKVNKLNTAS